MRQPTLTLFLLIIHNSGVLSSPPSKVHPDLRHLLQEHYDSFVHSVLVGYRNEKGLLHIEDCAEHNVKQGDALRRVHAIKAQLNASQVIDLELDPDITYLEPDYQYRLLGEVTPFGMTAIQATTNVLPQVSSTTTSQQSCSDPNSLKVAIVDSGIDIANPDLDFVEGENCIGAVFGLDDTYRWFDPKDSHGTAVAGILGATKNNHQGIPGLVGGGGAVCWIFARVFTSATELASLSDILEGVNWAAQQGANVMNLSLGGPGKTSTGQSLYEQLYNDGMVIVAAAGNNGQKDNFYPASYETVVSVGAVDENLNKATFSQFNEFVQLAAPGVQVLSTCKSGQGNAIFVHVENSDKAVVAQQFTYSAYPNNAQGELVECTSSGQSPCEGSGGHVCLIGRGQDTFEEKALKCQASGGAAVIIYNNEDGILKGQLASPSDVNIPVVGIRRNDGQDLLSNYVGQTVRFRIESDYQYFDGTSFASPHVAGVAAAIWESCRSCENTDIIQCLEDTARDLGESGRDEQFGYGLVQTEDAYLCLVNDNKCCASDSTPAPVTPGTDAPTAAPEACATEESAYKSCFATTMTDDSQAASCIDCINPNIPDDLVSTPCDVIISSVCPPLQNCGDCSSCRKEIEGYLDCVIASDNQDPTCRLDCLGPDPTNAPTVASTARATGAPTRSPSKAPTSHPSAFPTQSPTVFLTNAPTGSPTDPSTSSPTSAPTAPEVCAAEKAAYQSCLDSELPAGQADVCITCVNPSIPDDFGSVDCSKTNSDICGAIGVCYCGSCREKIEGYLNCAVGTVTQANCGLDCTAFAPTSAPTNRVTAPPTRLPTDQTTAPRGSPIAEPSPAPVQLTRIPTTSPTSSPSNAVQLTTRPSSSPSSSPSNAKDVVTNAPSNFLPEECPREDYLTCFENDLTAIQSEGCRSCVNGALPAAAIDCEALELQVCRAIASCDCGSCRIVVADFLSCLFSKDDCQINCDLSPSASPSHSRPEMDQSSGLSAMKASLFATTITFAAVALHYL